MNRRERDVIRMVREEGLELVNLTRNRHVHLTIRAPDGRTTKMVVASTTSDNQRCNHNNRARMRRFKKGEV